LLQKYIILEIKTRKISFFQPQSEQPVGNHMMAVNFGAQL